MSNNNTEKNKTSFYFLAAIFHKEDQDIEELLAPYDANLKVEPYFVMSKKEALEEYCDENARQNKSDEECLKELLEKGPLEWCTIDENGDFYSEENPDGKWSWWEYNSGIEYKMLKANGKLVFSAPVKDIDFSPDKEEYEKAISYWECAVEGKEPSTEEEEMIGYSSEYFLNHFKDKETFAKYHTLFSTTAVIRPNGKWYEIDTSEWECLPGNTPEELKAWKKVKRWREDYKKRFIDTAEPDWIMTLIICHI